MPRTMPCRVPTRPQHAYSTQQRPINVQFQHAHVADSGRLLNVPAAQPGRVID